MRGAVSARDAFRSFTAADRGMGYTGAVGAFFDTHADILDMPIALTFYASGRDAQVLAYVDQVVYDTYAVCQQTIGGLRVRARDFEGRGGLIGGPFVWAFTPGR